MIAMFIIGCSEDAAKQEKAPVAEEAVVKEAVEVAQAVKEVVAVEKIAQVEEAVAEKVAEVTADGALLYSKCAGCHGAKGEKAALGKSAVIGNWSVAQLEDALNGYKDGSYGGAMKGLMLGQVKDLDAAKITAIAEYIAKQ